MKLRSLSSNIARSVEPIALLQLGFRKNLLGTKSPVILYPPGSQAIVRRAYKSQRSAYN